MNERSDDIASRDFHAFFESTKFRWTSRKGLAAGLLMVLVLLFLSAVLVDQAIRKQREGAACVAHTQEVLHTLGTLESTLKDAETGERDYLLTSSPFALEPYNKAVADIHAAVQKLVRLIRAAPRQQARIPALNERIAAKLGELALTIELHRMDPEAARRMVLTNAGKHTMDTIRAQMAGMEQEELEQLPLREQRSRNSFRLAVVANLVTTVLGCAAVCGLFYQFLRALKFLRQIEQTRQENEQRLLGFLENSATISWLKDEDGYYAYLSGSYERHFGVRFADWQGKTDADVWPPEIAAIFRKNDLAVLAKEQPIELEEFTTTPDGKRTWWLSHKFVLRDSHGKRYVGGLGVDITDRKRAEEALHESQSLLAVNLDAMTRLQELGTLFIRDGNLEPVLTKIVDATLAISGADCGSIHLLSAASCDLQIAAQCGLPSWWIEACKHTSNGCGVYGTTLAHGERVIVEDIEQSPVFAGTPDLDLHRKAGVRAMQSTPLLSRSGALLGSLSTHYKSPQRPDARVLGFLDLLARQTADIIERAQAEEALRESEEKSRAAFAHAAIGFAIMDPDGRFLDANPAYCAVTGYTLDELRSRRSPDLIHPEDRSANVKLVQRMLAGEHPGFVLENRYVRKGGAPLWVRKSVSLVRDAAGAPQLILMLVEDVTERKQAEEALRESEERFRRLIEVSSQIIWVTNPQGHPNEDSPSWRAFTGCTVEEWMGSRWLEAVHPDDRARIKAAWNEAIATVGPYRAELRLRHHSGEYRHVSAQAVPLFHPDGSIRAWIGMNVDLTERKQTEEAKARAEAANEANRQKDHFLAMLGHELRNPLAPIRNTIAWMSRTASAESSFRRGFEIIDRQVRHMTRLIDDLLDVSRIAHGKITLRKEEFDLASVVRSTAQDQWPSFASSGVMLELATPPPPLLAYGDAARIAQVVGNLLINANKFTDRGGRVFVELRIEKDGQALISVRDTGIGMDAQTLKSVFQPFAQADLTIDRSHGGLGLGLALVKGLVELHGGAVSAKSAGLGQGSEFQVLLPILVQGMAEASKEPALALPRARPKRVLIIEDNVDAAESLRMLMELRGHQVMVSHGGADGLRQARIQKPEIVLCDIGLPGGVDGYAVARALRKDPELRAAFLIAMTGYGQDEDRRYAKEAGFDIHLTKPADPEQLERLLSR